MITLLLAAVVAQTTIGIRAEIQPLGKGNTGTVVGIVVQVAPEDRAKLAGKVRLAATLLRGGKIVESGDAVVDLALDGTALIYRDWTSGQGEVRVALESLDGTCRGGWSGAVEIPVLEKPFTVTPESQPDAKTLAPAVDNGEEVVRFLPPPSRSGLGALQLEVVVPDNAARVDFSQDGSLLNSRNRPPWTVSVPLGQIARKSTIRAQAFAADGSFIGEDGLVLNGPPGRIPLEILLGPEPPKPDGERTITIAVGNPGSVIEVTIKLDDKPLARWSSCPCIVKVKAAELANGRVLAAEAMGRGDLRGEFVQIIGQRDGFRESVRVEVVELPVTVVGEAGQLVSDLDKDAFKVFEDGVEVKVEAFSRTTDLPLSLGLLVDVSGSMVKPFPDVRKAVAGFASNLLRPGDSYFLVTFAFEPNTLIGWSRDASVLPAILERVTPDGGTSLWDAIVKSLDEFRGKKGRIAMVLLSDGDDTTSRTKAANAMRYVKTARVPIFPVGFKISTLEFGIRSGLKDLANTTGAEVFYASSKGELERVYQRINELLRSQYLLTYRSPSSKGASDFRPVKVEINRPGLKARTIVGYYPAE